MIIVARVRNPQSPLLARPESNTVTDEEELTRREQVVELKVAKLSVRVPPYYRHHHHSYLFKRTAHGLGHQKPNK
jgi:diaminopimelate decarboxylase